VPETPASIVSEYLRQVADTPSDAELLARFTAANDGEAFALLVRRHGPMVLGVCRRGAGDSAEDAFQATFLALARQARTIHESLPGWLHRVATRITQRSANRPSLALPAQAADATDLMADVEWREVRAVLDAELAALPIRLRTPLVLCYLDGLTRDEAARRMNCSLRTLHRRLDEGRRRLRDRLMRRGVAPVMLGATILTAEGLRAAVPNELIQRTLDQVSGATAVSPAVEQLIPPVSRMLGNAMKTLIVVALLAGSVTAVLAGHKQPGVELAVAPLPAEPPETPAPRFLPGKWTLYEWLAPNTPREEVVITIGEKDGKPIATAAESEDYRWQVTELTVTGRHVRIKLTRDESFGWTFDGLFDPADPTRVLGSYRMDVGSSADQATLELVRPGRVQKRTDPPKDFRYLAEVVQQTIQEQLAQESALEQLGLPRAAANAASGRAVRAKHGEEERKILRKLVIEQADNGYGLFAVQQLLSWVEHAKPPAEEIESWAKQIRPFAARHGPQFEAATLGQFATRLIRVEEYAPLARKFAAEAEKLGSPEFGKVVANWDEERAAWSKQPKPPKVDAVWTVTVRGTVIDAKGAPIAGAEVIVNRMSGVTVFWDHHTNRTASGPDGRYSITLKCQGTTRANITGMWAEKPGLARTDNTEDHKLLPGESASVDFVLKPGELFGGMLNVLRHPFDSNPDFQHLLEVKGDKVYRHVSVRNGERFSLLLPPGKYTVELHRGHNNLTWPNLKTGTTDHVFEEPPFRFTPETVGKGFDEMWNSMDRSYSYFALKPDVDWAKLRDEYRPKAIHAKSAEELTAVLKEMLGRLRDGHVWIMSPKDEQVPTYRTTWAYNGNRKVILDQLTDATACGNFAIVGKTKPDGFGYFLMTNQSAATPELVAKAVAAIEKLADAPGFIVDLRNANGGNELLAQDIARVFCDKRVVYAKSKQREGRGHDEFGPENVRELSPAKSGKPYLKPVVCLLGPGCVSSGEGFAQMMMALPHITTVGLPTRGSSGNPAGVEVGDTGLTVYFSRWVDMLPDGTPIEGKGVPPAIRVDVPADEYKTADATLAKALDVLRAKVK
jgi:RNA polymerase sigma factor (sigma-70 family)